MVIVGGHHQHGISGSRAFKRDQPPNGLPMEHDVIPLQLESVEKFQSGAV